MLRLADHNVTLTSSIFAVTKDFGSHLFWESIRFHFEDLHPGPLGFSVISSRNTQGEARRLHATTEQKKVNQGCADSYSGSSVLKNERGCTSS